MKNDLELRQDVERELSWDPRIDAGKIAVAAENGVVTIAGQVRDFQQKWAAEDIVKHVAGVAGIADELEVNLGGLHPDDSELTEKVVNALSWSVSVPAGKVKPVVRNGWVTLNGEVNWYFQKEAAVNVVRQLHGVKGLTNSIVINPMFEPRDVSKRITEALARNARIDARQISVKENGHTAILDGSVRSMAERDAAELAAWSAPGVNKVENHLRVHYI